MTVLSGKIEMGQGVTTCDRLEPGFSRCISRWDHAVFDAVDARILGLPMTPARVLAGIAAAESIRITV